MCPHGERVADRECHAADDPIAQMIVPTERLVNGIVLRTMGQNLAQFVGAVTGGVTIAAFRYGGAFAVLAGLYVRALIFMQRVRLPDRPVLT